MAEVGPLGRGIFALALLLWAATAWGANSPPVATDDPAESFGGALAVDVLANDGDADGEALKVAVHASGPGCTTTCEGEITVVLGVVRLEPFSHHPAACTICYSITDESHTVARARISVSLGAALTVFTDGFERGNTSRWSETWP